MAASAQQQAAMQNILAAGAQMIEKQLDEQIKTLDNFDDNDFADLRRKRLAALQKKAAMTQTWLSQGHGRYQEIQDEKDYFEECKTSDRVVCHFYRSTTWRCQIVDKHLEAIAKKHLETRFIKIDAEKCNFLVNRLSIVLMPTIIMSKDNHTEDRIEGFDELGGHDKFTMLDMERRLGKKGIIDFEEPVGPPPKKEFAISSNKEGKAIYGGRAVDFAEFSDGDFESSDDE